MTSTKNNILTTLGLYWREEFYEKCAEQGVSPSSFAADDAQCLVDEIYGGRLETLYARSMPFHYVLSHDQFHSFSVQAGAFQLLSAGLQYANCHSVETLQAFVIRSVTDSDAEPYGVLLTTCCSSSLLITPPRPADPESATLVSPGHLDTWFDPWFWDVSNCPGYASVPGVDHFFTCIAGHCESESQASSQKP